MSVRFLPKNQTLVLVTVLVLALVACSPFSRLRKADVTPTSEPTATSLPTQTPMPAVAAATPTPTRPTELATPTPTLTVTPLPTATEEPTSTPTAQVEQTAPVRGVTPAAAEPEIGDLILNGSFEEGFDQNGVAFKWTAFSTSKAGAAYAWQDETGTDHISTGEHAQLMRIMGPSKPNQFVGIYQTVEVVPGETYTVTMRGLIRSSLVDDTDNPFAFRYQWAADDGGRTNWTAVGWENWAELSWNDVQLDAVNPTMNAYATRITPQTDKVTFFIRGWSKWASFQSEAKFYVDGISIEGPVPAAKDAQATPVSQADLPTTGGSTGWLVPIAGTILVLSLALWQVRKNWAR
jgi:LPXTG-motif cell wall-anchored protein